MKKILLGACALMVVAAMTSCDKKAADTKATATDSLATAYGQYVGSMLASDFGSFDRSGNADKKEFIEGMMNAFGNDKSLSTRMGMQVGLQMLNEMNQLKEAGMEMDKAAVMNAFKKVFLADSLSMFESAEYSAKFRELYNRAEQEAAKAKAAEAAQAPEAVDNVKAGEEYVAKLRSENPNVKTTDSGLSYVIETEGVAPKPEASSTVVVNYTGKHLNGEVFDSTDGRGPATFNLQGVVPGFREGLMLLGKGGKATLYIPGALAYGPNGNQGIGPNEMLVFDVELLDIQE